MMALRWPKFLTPTSTIISKKSVERFNIFKFVMLPSSLAITLVSSANAPASWLRIIFKRAMCTSSPPVLSQPTSTQRSGVSAKFSRVSQSEVWIVTPLPVVMMPTILSPGSGWQQLAKCTAMPGIRPRMGISVFFSFLPLPPPKKKNVFFFFLFNGINKKRERGNQDVNGKLNQKMFIKFCC